MNPTTPPSLEVNHFTDHTLVRLVGCDSLNEYNSREVGKQLKSLVSEKNCVQVHLDLDGIAYASSTALGELVVLSRTLRQSGGQLVLLNPVPAVTEAIAVTRLDSILQIASCQGCAPRGLTA